jgi:hypothetical protein
VNVDSVGSLGEPHDIQNLAVRSHQHVKVDRTSGRIFCKIIVLEMAPRKVANGAENLILQVLQFQKMGFCRKFPGGASIIHYRSNHGSN